MLPNNVVFFQDSVVMVNNPAMQQHSSKPNQILIYQGKDSVLLTAQMKPLQNTQTDKLHSYKTLSGFVSISLRWFNFRTSRERSCLKPQTQAATETGDTKKSGMKTSSQK